VPYSFLIISSLYRFPFNCNNFLSLSRARAPPHRAVNSLDFPTISAFPCHRFSYSNRDKWDERARERERERKYIFLMHLYTFLAVPSMTLPADKNVGLELPRRYSRAHERAHLSRKR